MSNLKTNLLIVDDEPSTRTLFSQIFRELGHFVRCAEDGFSALEEIRAEEPKSCSQI
jgi:CheY-like chemotaxis protein